MPVHIFDLDGTLVYHGTNKPLPGAVEKLKGLTEAGDRIILMTRRGNREFEGHPKYDQSSVWCAVKALGLSIMGIQVITDCDSPRIIYNDEGCSAVKRETNQEWTP